MKNIIDKYPEVPIMALTFKILDLVTGIPPDEEREVILKFSEEDKEKFFKDIAKYTSLFTPIRGSENKEFRGPNNIRVILDDNNSKEL